MCPLLEKGVFREPGESVVVAMLKIKHPGGGEPWPDTLPTAVNQ